MIVLHPVGKHHGCTAGAKGHFASGPEDPIGSDQAADPLAKLKELVVKAQSAYLGPASALEIWAKVAICRQAGEPLRNKRLRQRSGNRLPFS